MEGFVAALGRMEQVQDRRRNGELLFRFGLIAYRHWNIPLGTSTLSLNTVRTHPSYTQSFELLSAPKKISHVRP